MSESTLPPTLEECHELIVSLKAKNASLSSKLLAMHRRLRALDSNKTEKVPQSPAVPTSSIVSPPPPLEPPASSPPPCAGESPTSDLTFRCRLADSSSKKANSRYRFSSDDDTPPSPLPMPPAPPIDAWRPAPTAPPPPPFDHFLVLSPDVLSLDEESGEAGKRGREAGVLNKFGTYLLDALTQHEQQQQQQQQQQPPLPPSSAAASAARRASSWFGSLTSAVGGASSAISSTFHPSPPSSTVPPSPPPSSASFSTAVTFAPDRRSATLTQPPLLVLLHVSAPGAPALLPLRDIGHFAFPQGAQVSPVVASPRSSMTDLNAILYGNYARRNDCSFIFTINDDTGSDDKIKGREEADGKGGGAKITGCHTLYGLCIVQPRVLGPAPSSSSSSSSSLPPSRLLSVPRVYCLLTRVPHFELHFKVLRDVVSAQRLGSDDGGARGYDTLSFVKDVMERYRDKRGVGEVGGEDRTGGEWPAWGGGDKGGATQYGSFQVCPHLPPVVFRPVLVGAAGNRVYGAVTDLRASLLRTGVAPLDTETRGEGQGWQDKKRNAVSATAEWSLAPLFSVVPSRVLVTTLSELMKETQVIVLSKRLGLLSASVLGIAYLLKPMLFCGPVIPVLPLSMSEVVMAPCPYLIGIPSSEVPADLPLQDGVLLVKLDADGGATIEYSGGGHHRSSAAAECPFLLPGGERLLSSLKSVYAEVHSPAAMPPRSARSAAASPFAQNKSSSASSPPLSSLPLPIALSSLRLLAAASTPPVLRPVAPRTPTYAPSSRQRNAAAKIAARIREHLTSVCRAGLGRAWPKDEDVEPREMADDLLKDFEDAEGIGKSICTVSSLSSFKGKILKPADDGSREEGGALESSFDAMFGEAAAGPSTAGAPSPDESCKENEQREAELKEIQRYLTVLKSTQMFQIFAEEEWKRIGQVGGVDDGVRRRLAGVEEEEGNYEDDAVYDFDAPDEGENKENEDCDFNVDRKEEDGEDKTPPRRRGSSLGEAPQNSLFQPSPATMKIRINEMRDRGLVLESVEF